MVKRKIRANTGNVNKKSYQQGEKKQVKLVQKLCKQNAIYTKTTVNGIMKKKAKHSTYEKQGKQ